MAELCLLHNIATETWRGGNTRKARELFDASRDLYDCFPDRILQLRRLWLEGRINWAEEHLEAAERSYRAAWNGFLRRDLRYEAGLAALELAGFHAEESRNQEAAELVESSLPAFQEIGVTGKVREAHALLERVNR